MQTYELIGIAIFATVILLATFQVGWAFGHEIGQQRGQSRERRTADRRVQGVLNSVNQSRPSRRLTYRKVNARNVGKKRYLNSRMPGEVVA